MNFRANIEEVIVGQMLRVAILPYSTVISLPGKIPDLI